MSEVIHRLHRSVLREADEPTDARLLEGFVARRDPAALEAIVRRHSRMVWGVCRRILCDHHDAEDAFQATFLVLVRKAASVVPREMLANWLYGVARRTALNARATAARRRSSEKQVNAMPEPEAAEPEDQSELRAVLDDALDGLPDRYRVAVVLCDLEGRSRSEAARQLGVPEGTVASRLARARALLARRLARHGLTLSGAALATIWLEGAAPACVPAELVTATIKSTTLVAAGTAAAGVIPARVAALADGVLRTMLLNKLKARALALLLFALVGLGAWGIGWLPGTAPQADAGQAEPAAAAPAGKGAGPVAAPKAGKKEPVEARPDKDEWIVMKVKFVPAPGLVKLADTLLGGPAAGGPRLVADPHTNAVLARGTPQQIAELRRLIIVLDVPAAEPRPGEPGAEPADAVLTVKVYPVGDLVLKDGTSLVDVISKTIKPASWTMMGGEGSIQYFADGKALVIRQSDPVHMQIDRLLRDLLVAKHSQQKVRDQKE
jgi:RNA polymerase sigma factor (sigma-70 family)